MSLRFSWIGTLVKPRDDSKFLVERTVGNGKYKSRKLNFSVRTCGSSHFVTVESFTPTDENGEIFSFSKGEYDETGHQIRKGEAIRIKFKDRLSYDLDDVAEFRKYVLDLDTRQRRNLLKNIADNGAESDDALLKAGIASEDAAQEAYDKSLKKRHEFISAYDFIDVIAKALNSGKYNGKKFNVVGEMQKNSNPRDGRIYTSYVVQKIYMVPDDTAERNEGTLELMFSQNSFDTNRLDDEHKVYVHGYEAEYDSSKKKNTLYPVSIAIPMADDKKEKNLLNKLEEIFTVNDDEKINELGVIINMIDGSPRVEITEDMLSEDQKENIELGLCTFDDIRREMGGSVYGDRITEFDFVKLARGYSSGAKETAYTIYDVYGNEKVSENDDEDLPFDDDDDI